MRSVDPTALYPPKRFLGAARYIEIGGSLTTLATALVENRTNVEFLMQIAKTTPGE